MVEGSSEELHVINCLFGKIALMFSALLMLNLNSPMSNAEFINEARIEAGNEHITVPNIRITALKFLLQNLQYQKMVCLLVKIGSFEPNMNVIVDCHRDGQLLEFGRIRVD